MKKYRVRVDVIKRSEFIDIFANGESEALKKARKLVDDPAVSLDVVSVDGISKLGGCCVEKKQCL